MKWFVAKKVNNFLTKYDTVIGGEDDLRMTLQRRYGINPHATEAIESIIEDLRKDNVTSTTLTKAHTVITITKAYNE